MDAVRYMHDCEVCKSVGKLERYDLYVCPHGGHPTIVARWGDDGPEYISGADIDLFDVGIKLTLIKP